MEAEILEKLQNKRIGLVTNQAAFGALERKYHFQILKEKLNLKKIFLPEHGLFAELQDQVSGSSLGYDLEGIEIVNLYGDEESSLVPSESDLQGLDVILIDIRDAGSRYYTFLTTCLYLMQAARKELEQGHAGLLFLVFDSPNPAGKKMEGSPLIKQYESFVGVESVIHRHGLTPGQLLRYYNSFFSLGLNLEVIPVGTIYPAKDKHSHWIPLSPNIPTLNTCLVYPGQCLLEGTNLSEGRGTTRPFEIFGAPFVDAMDPSLLSELQKYQSEFFYLRPLRFVPAFHKWENKICGGFQLFVNKKKKFHSLLFSLHMIRTLKEWYPDSFQFKQGVYEFRSDKPAIELLCGDPFLLDFLHGFIDYQDLERYLKNTQKAWKRTVKEHLETAEIEEEV